MTAYYNEFDPHAAQWLRELIEIGIIAPGVVDDRSITEVTANDLQGFTQCHFFAGIGGWSAALRLAKWPDDKPVWTGSAPCQPFSAAGNQKGTKDDRHLFPVWMRLIKECRPTVIFGEQVEAAIRHGWLDLVSDDLEAEDYACGAVCLPACSIGAPHIRQRLWFVAERLAESKLCRCERKQEQHPARVQPKVDEQGESRLTVGTHCSGVCRLADTNNTRPQGHGQLGKQHDQTGWEKQVGLCAESGGFGRLADTEGGRQWNGIEETRRESGDQGEYRTSGGFGRLAESHINRLEQRSEAPTPPRYRYPSEPKGSSNQPRQTDKNSSFWRNPDWLGCRDGKWRPVESGTSPLVNGLPRGVVPVCNPSEQGYAEKTAEARVMRLKGYGNAIVPQVAAEIIKLIMEKEQTNDR